jgi:hypothetical protein
MRSSVHGRQSHTRRAASEHEFRIWCLIQAIEAGRWCDAGLHREVSDGVVLGYWKKLECGCLVAIEVES